MNDLISRDYVEKIIESGIVDLKDGTEEWRAFVNETCYYILNKVHNAPTVDDERIGRVVETIQTVIDNTNGNTDNVSKAMRNTAKFIRNAIDGEMPDYENIEGEDCAEQPTGEWGEVFHHQGYNYHKCSKCCFSVKLADYDNYCPNCGAKMKGGEGE